MVLIYRVFCYIQAFPFYLGENYMTPNCYFDANFHSRTITANDVPKMVVQTIDRNSLIRVI